MLTRALQLPHIYTRLLIVMLAAFAASGCNPTRKVPAGRYLLVENNIIDKSTTIDKAELESYIKQKPNRKILGLVRFHLALYNMVDERKNDIRKLNRNKRYKRVNERRQNREDRKNVRRTARNNRKNIKRKEKGKPEQDPKRYYAKFKNPDKQTWREWLMDIGEAPVILDSMLMEKSTRQIKLLLNNKGYFNSTVSDSIVIKEKLKHQLVRNIKELFGAEYPVKRASQKAEVYYVITAAAPYTIRKIDYEIEDNLLSYYVFTDTAGRIIQPGQNYDVARLQAERNRIATSLKNNGFYDFVREYVHFRVDTNLQSHQMDITIGIKKFAKPVTNDGDSIVEVPHQRYQINEIYIVTDFNASNPKAIPSDTTWYRASDNTSSNQPIPAYDYIFLHNGPLLYRPYVIANELEMYRNQLYQLSNSEATYKRLADLRAFKLVSIRFEPVASRNDKLNCYILLTPIMRQAYTLQTEGTNSGGNLGIAGSLVYQNKNTLQGAEILEVRLKGALEAQKLITGGETENTNLTFFNTIEFGPQVSYNVPRPIPPFRWFKFERLANPKTSFTATYNFQQRPEYTRSVLNFSYSLNFKQEPKTFFPAGTVIRHSVFFPELSFVKVNKSTGFEQALINSNNLLLINQFTDHATPALRWVSVFDNQRLKGRKKHYFLRLSGEASGNILRSVRVLYDWAADNEVPESYEILNVPHSQYLRGEVDFRRYNQLSQHSTFVTRFAAGMGLPYENLNVLPFERSFFAGGSNSIRAWRARSLGPGGYQSAFGEAFDQIGDIQFEGNFELRFNVIKMINAAWFVDFGNIWLRKPDPKRVGGEFDLGRIIREGEIAIGAGAGIRVDFDFFIIRMDAGVKVRDPRFGPEGRWVITNIFDKEWKQNYANYYSEPGSSTEEQVKYPFINLNLGIGYPF